MTQTKHSPELLEAANSLLLALQSVAQTGSDVVHFDKIEKEWSDLGVAVAEARRQQAGSNTLNKPAANLTPKQLAFNSMQHALAYIQDQLGITSGDFAGVYFSDDDREAPILEILADYAREELRNIAHKTPLNDKA